MIFFDSLPFVSFWVLAGMLAGRILMLKKQGVQVSSKDGKKNKTAMFLFPVFVIIFLLWFVEIIKPAFQLSFSILPEILTNDIFENIFLKISGSVIIIFSLILLAVTLIHFNTSLRFGLDKNNHGKLVTKGVFSISRNPFFLSLDIYFIGITLIFPTMFFVGFALLVLVGIHSFILREEKFMLEVYKEEYEKYIKKVSRYFNF
ncbi:methyltransferase family protein [Maribellus maritimus]|uniref:methyltransferase family protein n=1 Tax=Maribellus maritimus TaxID=2870838 RepID=UPI001EEBF5B7|nr:methyltransferase [Maribellus maritimus]MCG6187173.1 DUF1295 domain-containing protein [Maribellus maritimus]